MVSAPGGIWAPATRAAMYDLFPRNSDHGRGARGGKCRVCAGGTNAPWLPGEARVDATRIRPTGKRLVGLHSNVRGKYAVNPSWYSQRSFANDLGGNWCEPRLVSIGALSEVLTGATRPPRPNGRCWCRQGSNKPGDDARERQRGDSHDPPFHNKRGKGTKHSWRDSTQTSARGCLLEPLERVVRSPVNRTTSKAGPHGAGRGDSPARDEIVDDGWTFLYRQEPCSNARAGWKRAACAESAERSEPRSCSPGRCWRTSKGVCWRDVDEPGCESGIAAATWQTRCDDPAPKEVDSTNLLMRKGCGGNESVAPRGTEPATGSATTPAVAGVLHLLARRGGEAARYGLDGSARMATCVGNNGRASDPFPRLK